MYVDRITSTYATVSERCGNWHFKEIRERERTRAGEKNQKVHLSETKESVREVFQKDAAEKLRISPFDHFNRRR